MGRPYDRLNHDYRPMHALAAFFLEHTGPTHRRGDARMVPFLLNMAVLFEKFVAAWLKENLSSDLRIADQVGDFYDVEHQIGMSIDLVLSDRFGRHLAVLDTKYKKHQSPTQNDINQAVAYASKKRCAEAILIYPHAITMKHTINVGDVRVRAVGFPLHASLQEGGAEIMSLLRQVTTQAHSL
jgi:5-methylcytosine-specific restriction enzyme subunit McrC